MQEYQVSICFKLFLCTSSFTYRREYKRSLLPDHYQIDSVVYLEV